MVSYKVLTAKNCDYNANLIRRLDVLYKGGYAVSDNAEMFLSKMASETPASFEDRKKCVSYLPFFSDIVDFYNSMLFSKEISITEAGDADDPNTLGNESDDESVYKMFFAASDISGKSFEEAMACVFGESLVQTKAYIGIDFPKTEEQPINLLEEEVLQSGRPFLYFIDPECLIDWAYNEGGTFKWVKLEYDNVIQEDPLSVPMHQLEWKIWKMDGEFARWEVYQSRLLEIGKLPAPTDDFSLFDSGLTTIKQIPILELCLPDGLALGKKIAPICEDIYQRSSILVNGQNKSLNAIRVVYLGNEGPAPGGPLPSQVQENPFRQFNLISDWESKGVACLGANDKMDVIESKGHAFQIAADGIDKLKENLKEVVHQMANSAAHQVKQTNRSALAMREGRHSIEILLTAYGEIVRGFIKRIMNCISTARNESIVWTVDGLDNFSVVDRDQLINEAKLFPNIASDSKSLTFSRLYTEKFYLSLLDGASHEDALQIRAEIMESIDDLPDPEEENQQSNQMVSNTQSSSDGTSDESMALGPAGQPLMPEGSHLQTGEHIDSSVVFNHLAEDYNEKDIEFVKHIPWVGPVEVPLSSIDFSNKDNWQASNEEGEVDKFAEKMSEGFDKPIVLVNNPSNDNKMVIVDGHHRALAALQNDTPINAYIGQIGSDSGPWDKLHAKQANNKQASGQLKSNQMNETSMQKEVSTQVQKSEKAQGGKTK